MVVLCRTGSQVFGVVHHALWPQ